MKFLFLLVVALLLQPRCAIAQATRERSTDQDPRQRTIDQSARQRTVDQSQMSFVPEEVRLIEQDSLPLDPSLQGSNRPSGDSRGAADGKPTDNGLKLFRFVLAPGQKLTTRITSDLADVVTQRFGLLSGPGFTPSTASKAQVARIDQLNRQQRATKIEFKNLENRPFPLLLIVYGQVGYPFKIEITRN